MADKAAVTLIYTDAILQVFCSLFILLTVVVVVCLNLVSVSYVWVARAVDPICDGGFSGWQS